MTASVTMMPEITRAVGVPRALVVPFELGRPFGGPGDVTVQHAVLRALLDLCDQSDAPTLREFT